MNYWILWKDLDTKVKYKIKTKWENIKATFLVSSGQNESRLKRRDNSNFIAVQSKYFYYFYVNFTFKGKYLIKINL